MERGTRLDSLGRMKQDKSKIYTCQGMDRRADNEILRLGVGCRPFGCQPGWARLHRQGSALDGGCHTKVTGVSASVQNRQRGLELVVSKPALYLEDLGRLARRRVFLARRVCLARVVRVQASVGNGAAAKNWEVP